MNQKFKINLVALVAVLSGSLIGTSHGRQSYPDSSGDQGLVRLVKPSSAIRAATDNDPVSPATVQEGFYPLPPIVSPSDNPAYPPIVSPPPAEQAPIAVKKPFSLLEPIISVNPEPDLPTAPVDQNDIALPLIVQAPKSPPKTDDLAVESPATEIPATEIPATEIPATESLDVIRAASDRFVAPSPLAVQPTTIQPTDDQVSEVIATAPPTQPQSQSEKRVSTAGIPIYPATTDPSLVPVEQSAPPAIATIQPNSPLAPPVLPPVTSEIPKQLPALINWDHRLVASEEQDEPALPQAINQVYTAPADIAPVDPSFPPNPTYFAPQAGDLPAIQPSPMGCPCGGVGCSLCGGGGYSPNDVAGCQSCGPGGCFDPAHVAARFGDSGSISAARSYMVIDLLYFTRNDGQVVFSNFGSATQFDNNAGLRVTYGIRADATRGREFTYLGSLPLEETFTRTDPLGRINSRILPGDGFGLAETSSFFNVVEQTLEKKTILQSLEFNRVKWGWDVVKTFIGIRYIYVEDELRVYSRNLAGETGTFGIHSLNNLVGPHVGSEIFYDVGKRFSYSLVSKVGIYANPNKTDTEMTNDGVNYLGTEKYNQTISGSIEINLMARFQLTRRSRFRFGYTGLWLGDVTTVSDNIPTTLTPSTGIDASDSDDMFFSAFSFGWEAYR